MYLINGVHLGKNCLDSDESQRALSPERPA
ncbi:hypothetical protein BCPG1_165 [Bacillus phage BCPG1]|nr:hypothetical protein BCPG1_165 [Bacillus phage BCPG1]